MPGEEQRNGKKMPSDKESMTYSQAIDKLHAQGYEISWGCDLGAPEERALTADETVPVFVTNYPKECKAFYMETACHARRVIPRPISPTAAREAHLRAGDALRSKWAALREMASSMASPSVPGDGDLPFAVLRSISRAMRERAEVMFFGKVQGVSFRAYTRRYAIVAGVNGWVQNLPDGSVVAVFEGERSDIEHGRSQVIRG